MHSAALSQRRNLHTAPAVGRRLPPRSMFMKPLALIAALLLVIHPVNARENASVSVVELLRPNSATFSIGQADVRKSEILSNEPTPKLEGWKNPYTGFCVHVHQNDKLTVYGHWGSAAQLNQQTIRTVTEIKQMAAEIPLYGNPAGILITSDVPLRESKVFPELLNAFFTPSIQLFYAKNPKLGGAANGSRPTRSDTNTTSSAAGFWR